MPGPGAYWIDEEERNEVMESFRFRLLFFGTGDFEDPNFKHKVYSFEQEFAAYCGVEHASDDKLRGPVPYWLLPQRSPWSRATRSSYRLYTFVASYTALVFSRRCAGSRRKSTRV